MTDADIALRHLKALEFELIRQVVIALRRIRAEYHLPPDAWMTAYLVLLERAP